jgi:predicted transglutaminase-like cysteine proteinase
MASMAVLQSATVTSGEMVEAPRGFLEMCERDAELCGVQKSGFQKASFQQTGGVDWTADPAATMRLLNIVNRKVNREVNQVSDRMSAGVEEQWNRPIETRSGLEGDCEDIAIEKRERLVASGFPEHDLFFAVVYRRDIGLHAVLVARTAGGDMVLDSRSPWIMEWNKTPYVWVKRQDPDSPMNWAMVVPSAPKTMPITASYQVAANTLQVPTNQ